LKAIHGLIQLKTMAKTLESKPSGSAETTPVAEGFSLISNEKLIAIYVAMVKCRMLEQKAATLFQQGKLASDFHASSGREACAVAVGIDLQPEDTLITAPGDWLSTFMKGLPLESLFRALAPKVDGQPALSADEVKRRNILANSAAGEQTEPLLESAAAAKEDKKGAIVAAFLDPVPDSPNRWQKAMVAAAEKKLPIIFVHQLTNLLPNTGADSVKAKGKTPQALFNGIPSINVDASDPVALYRVAYEAMTRARQNRGATLLECATIPVAVPSDATGKTLPDSFSVMETYLKGKGLQPEHYTRDMVAGFTRDLELATRFLEL
jgi:acetoin:2,6-dichlorophenolindophenol oxidoreductase subunit alpha